MGENINPAINFFLLFSWIFFFLNRFQPTPEDILLKAFERLDSENKGYLTKDEITKFLTEEGQSWWYLWKDLFSLTQDYWK